MKSISFNNLIKLINEYIDKRIEPDYIITIRDCYKDKKIFTVELEDETFEFSELNEPEFHNYDNIFESLKKEFEGNFKTYKIYQKNYGYRFVFVINLGIVIEFKYSLPEGKNWLINAYKRA